MSIETTGELAPERSSPKVGRRALRRTTTPGRTLRRDAELLAYSVVRADDLMLGEEADVIDITAAIEDRQADEANQAEIEVRFATAYFATVNGRSKPLTRKLALDIMDVGPLAIGIDDRMWAYSDGVWRPTKNVVEHRATRLLQECYKPDWANAAGDIIHAELKYAGRKIDGSPIPEVINFKNGLLYWKTGEFRLHDPEVMSTIQLNTNWNPDAKCPKLNKFLPTTVKADMIDIVWEAIGYLMFNGNPLHKAIMLTGTGRNGKGTLLHTIEKLLGKENITARSLQSLTNERFAPADLFNKLANIAGDIDGTYMSETARFKGITGEDTITAEFKGTNSFEFTPWAVPVFSANKIPGSADVTTGYLSRWLVINFPNNFTGKRRPGTRRPDRRLRRNSKESPPRPSPTFGD